MDKSSSTSPRLVQFCSPEKSLDHYTGFMSLLISTELFVAFLNCKYKSYLKATGASGTASEYETIATSLDEKYRSRVARRLLGAVPVDRVVASPKSIDHAIRQDFQAITNACVVTGEVVHRLPVYWSSDFRWPFSVGIGPHGISTESRWTTSPMSTNSSHRGV